MSGPQPSHVTVVTSREQSPAPSWKASVAIGGMTCASCSNAITNALKKKDWVSNVAVNLLTNSASVELQDKVKANQIVDAIEDLGYEANLNEVVEVTPEQPGPRGDERTVQIYIEGFYCDHCGNRAMNSLAEFLGNLEILSQPTLQNPILKIKYTPEAPLLNIRHILAAVEATDPAFTASIYHPPSLEERSKLIEIRHRQQLLRRWIGTLVIAIPTFIIGIVYMSLVPDSDNSKMFLMKPWVSGINRAQIILFTLATPVFFFAADVFHRRAIKEIGSLWRRGSQTPVLQRFYRFGSMNTLMSLGTTIAYVSSCCQLIAAGATNPERVDDTNFYFDSVVFLTLFLLLGKLIESYSKSKTGDAVKELSKLRPTTAILFEKDEKEQSFTQVINAELLDFGDIVRVVNGASPPCDGIVVDGESQFDESSLTGESRPIRKSAGDKVFAGTVNKEAPILVQVTGPAGQSMLDQIVNIVREGQTKRAPMEKIADKLTAYFVPTVTLVAIITWLVWLILGYAGVLPPHYLDMNSGSWIAFSLQFAIAVFVVACPCGVGLAAPTAIFVGGDLASKYGILVKGGGEAFEKASGIDCVVFDKTGTLTMGGEPTITDSKLYPLDLDKKQSNTLLAALRAVEENSSHPIAKAIVSFCDVKTTERAQVTNVEEKPGKGLKATYDAKLPDHGFDMIVGNEALMQEFDVAIPAEVKSSLDTWKTEAKSVALVATKSADPDSDSVYQISAALSISDPIRPESAPMIRALHSQGVDVWMLSGDNETTARAVATRVGIPPDTNVIAGVLPAEKASKIKYLQKTLKAGEATKKASSTKRATIAMVGDGINDAPALAVADVGIAIGDGSDVAISSADFVLIKSDVRSVVTLLELSRCVFRRIWFNFGWALVYNVLAVPVAAGCFYAIETGSGHVRLDPVWASLAMALSSISVVLSSLALKSSWLPWLGFRATKIEVE